ncbi:MAG: hypothetical protein H6731_08260 [Myxococcales bacterium]|nr:MAG: hypothetical protein H6731_08260 [Myxococcales bacterium]
MKTCKNFMVLVFLLFISLSSQAKIIGMLMDCEENPVNIYAKKAGIDILIKVEKSKKFIECVFQAGSVFGDDKLFNEIKDSNDKRITLSLYEFQKDGNQYNGQAENQAFFDGENYVHELSFKDEIYNSLTDQDGRDELFKNDNVILLLLQSLDKRDYDSNVEQVLIKINELKEDYKLVYEAKFK